MGQDQQLGLGIPHIIRRRARWVSAKLRHQRGGTATTGADARTGTGS